jgi:hypothetical protein
MIQNGVMEGMNEINGFKELNQIAEREKFMLKNSIEQSNMELNRLADDNNRLRQLMERERQEHREEFLRLKQNISDLDFKLA